MKISYDKKTDAMYVSFKKGRYNYTKKVTESVLVDFSKENKVLGLEILDVSKNIGKVTSLKEETQKHKSLS